MEGMELTGKVVVVPVDWACAAGLAGRMVAGGATVVLVGGDGEAAGLLAAELEAAGRGRPGIFVTDGTPESYDALAAYLAELFR